MNVILEGLEPFAAWDSNGPDWWADGAPRLPRVAWLNAVACPRISTDRLTRIEFYLLDIPFAVTYRLARGEDGRIRIDEESGEAVKEPPVIVPLAELPPAYLLATA